MGLIKRADIEGYTRDSYVMDLDDLEVRGRTMIEVANAEAHSILSMANAKRKQMLATAEKDGYAKGHHDGYEQGYIDGVVNGVEDAKKDRMEVLDQLMEIWVAQLDAFELQRDTMLEQARTQVVELGAMIASKVTRRIVELDPTVVLKQIEAALSSVTESTRLVVAVHPDDIETAREALPRLVEKFSTYEHAQIVTDASIGRGSCVARTANGGVIDASITTQLDRVIDAILPHRQHQPEMGRVETDSQTSQLQGDSISDSQPDDDLSKEDAA